MLTTRSPVAVAFAVLVWTLSLLMAVEAVPQRQRGGRTPQQQAALSPQGVKKGQDGSTILDTTATVNGLQLRYKISGPANQFTTASNVTGGTQSPGAKGNLGLHVLLHGDGGQSFFDYPNQVQQGNLMGVVVLAPSEQLLWGQNTGQPSGLSRKDGAADSAALADLVTKTLPQVVAFNQSNVYFTGVSGGALTLSGYFLPAHIQKFAGNGAMLMCGALPPQVDVVDPKAFASTRIHYQTSQQELSSLQPAFPKAIRAYEKLAAAAGLNNDQIGALQTVDSTPTGGHCAFDGKAYTSGIQLVANHYQSIMQAGSGAVPGINTKTVRKPVVGNENVKFSGSAA